MREFGGLRGTAEAAAAAGAAALRPFLDGRRALDVSPKSRHDFVTAADVASERAVAAAIRAAHPDHRILGEEESRASLDDPGFVWIVDPLDGTTNFIHGYPVFAVSVAVARDGEVVAGVVVDVPRGEVYAAARGEGATQGGTPIRVSSRPGIADALIGTGFPFRKQDRLDKYLASFRAVVADTAGIRRAGSAALDLCAVAAGRF
ncbi:MAG TPA: inositol monophosphatase family protein, partial [Acidobacteriota bacterium]|nr:inositol monophosphatase family protein [Acidobacteriota bacterium]